jgi:ABC-type protease/lipase transport system fused ATPase/permease subunit
MAIITAIRFVSKVSLYMATFINKRFWASKKKLKRLKKLQMKRETKQKNKKRDTNVFWELGLVNSTIQMTSKKKTKISAFEQRIGNKSISKIWKNFRRPGAFLSGLSKREMTLYQWVILFSWKLLFFLNFKCKLTF